MPYRFALLAFVVAAPALAQTVPTSSEEPTTIDAERIEGVGELEVTARGNAEIRQGDFSVFGEVLHALLPRVAQIVMNTSFRMFPDSEAAKGRKEGEAPQVTADQIALSNLMRGIHF